MGGDSNQQEYYTTKQYFLVAKYFGLKKIRTYYYRKLIWVYLIETIVKKVLPKNLIYSLQNQFRKFLSIN